MKDMFTQFPWMDEAIKIIIFFLLAWLVSKVTVWFAKRRPRRSKRIAPERQATIQSLMASAISLIAFVSAGLLSIGLFIEADTLLWVVGLFSAAFGLGARPVISDYLTGFSFIFEDTFSIGEKVEIFGMPSIEGVIETISMRTSSLRAPTGELYIVPNGEIRIIRNFSRGKFSVLKITLKIAASDIGSAIDLLESLSKEAMLQLPNLIEPWQIISPAGVIGQNTELTLIAKAKFGKAAEMQPKLLDLVQQRLGESGISLSP